MYVVMEIKAEPLQEGEEYDPIKRLAAEILLSVFNDILPSSYYQYYSIELLRNRDKVYARRKLKAHYEAINWLLKDCKKHWTFKILGIQSISEERIMEAIARKFNGNIRFNKMVGEYLKGGSYDP